MPGLSRTERLRRSHKPDEVRILFIGESAPAGGDFFYAADSKLYRSTRAAFEAAIPTLRREADFLAAFQRLGCYLEDLALVPVNRLSDDERAAEYQRGVGPLTRRIKPYAPHAVTLVIKRIGPWATAALTDAGLSEIPRTDLPFPGRQQHTLRYEAELAVLVRKWRRRKLLIL